MARLRRELDYLVRRHSQEQQQWAEERRGLVAELGRRRQESGCPASPGELRQEVEEKVRQVLAMLRSLNTMKISEEVLGRLVLEAVEEAYQSTRDYETLVTRGRSPTACSPQPSRPRTRYRGIILVSLSLAVQI